MDRLILPDAAWRHRTGLTELAAVLGADQGLARYVGGAVRDTLLGLPAADIDLATPLDPHEVMARLKAAHIKAVPTGIAHGTVTAVLPGGPIEVTTLRHDLETDGRHAKVAFTDDWQADAGRRDFTRRVHRVAATAVAFGASVLVGGFVGFVLLPARSPIERIALFTAVAAGALQVGAALSLFGRSAQARGAARKRMPSGRGDRTMHVVALLLGVALGCGFVSSHASPEFGISVLFAGCVLYAALGARLMSGAQRPWPARSGVVEALPLHEPFSATFNASFAGVPDDLLVAACGGGAFEPAWLAAGDAQHGCAGRAGHHASQDLPRRRRSRGGALRQRQGPH